MPGQERPGVPFIFDSVFSAYATSLYNRKKYYKANDD